MSNSSSSGGSSLADVLTIERPDSPTFTEVCKISVRSAQKLLDHVNFSPLHKAALEGGSKADDRLALGSPKLSQQRRVIYDGTKLFWRINETLELCIYEDAGANCVTITAFQQQSAEKPAPVQVDLRSLLKVLGVELPIPHGHGAHHQQKQKADHAAEMMSKYLLARVQAKKDARGHISLFLAKVHEHETLPTLLAHGSHHFAHGLPTDLAVRRRHTIDDVKEAQKEVQNAAVELKKARVQAEQLSNLARISLEAFSKRGSHQPEQAGSGAHSEWLRVYDRVTMKNAVEHSKGFLQALGKQ
ncbi:hypothetical protein PybrP1_003302 [[Pythium] brassicae (nom. inval.)]|nr:hypothetical protein PybrP1_003302 [[Pythium] brassicae (nom. inval.)]